MNESSGEIVEKTEPKLSEKITDEPIISSYKNLFKCTNCDLYAKYDYYGNKPAEHYLKTSKDSLILLENCYICDDPFSDLRTNYLILGSNCIECKNMICLNSDCSIFYYNKRFCIKCAIKNLDEFPNEIKNELKKFE